MIVVIWLIVPNSAEAVAVPATIASPPPITVMKVLAMYASPIVGSTPLTGARIAPARPDSAAPTANATV